MQVHIGISSQLQLHQRETKLFNRSGQKLVSSYFPCHIDNECPKVCPWRYEQMFSVTRIETSSSCFFLFCFFFYPSYSYALAEPLKRAWDMAICFNGPPILFFFCVCVSNEGFGETACMYRLAWTIAVRLCDKYSIFTLAHLISFP